MTIIINNSLRILNIYFISTNILRSLITKVSLKSSPNRAISEVKLNTYTLSRTSRCSLRTTHSMILWNLKVINCDSSLKLIIRCVLIANTLYKSSTISFKNFICVFLNKCFLVLLRDTLCSHKRLTICLIELNALSNIPSSSSLTNLILTLRSININAKLISYCNCIFSLTCNSIVNTSDIVKEHNVTTYRNIKCLRYWRSNSETTNCRTSNKLWLCVNY